MTFIFIHYEIVEKRKKAFIDNRHHLQTAEKSELSWRLNSSVFVVWWLFVG